MTKALRIALAAGATLAVAASAGTPAQASAHSCAKAGSQTRAANSSARVYSQGKKTTVCLKSSGRSFVLKGVSAFDDHFALSGRWLGYTTTVDGTPSTVHDLNLSTRHELKGFPYRTNDDVEMLAVKPSGAIAWSAISSDDSRYVQGKDRANHSPDLLSDDTKKVDPQSLHSTSGRGIAWSYDDGSTGAASLF